MITRTCERLAILSTWLLLILAASANADNTLKLCENCHGADGLGTESDVPIIAGLPVEVQEDALYAYLDGDRDCGSKPMMCKLMSRLTEEQIVELAAHYAAMSFSPAGEEFDAALAEKGQAIHQDECALCHGESGLGNTEASILFGQRMEYLHYALRQYAAAQRKQLPAMEKKAVKLTGDDIEALVHYYASYHE